MFDMICILNNRVVFYWALLQETVMARRGSRGGGPPVFASNYFKSPLNWPKYAYKLAPETPAPPPFSILNPPLMANKYALDVSMHIAPPPPPPSFR